MTSLTSVQQSQNYLTREFWGPRFWKVLHTMAECIGRQPTLIQSNDEADAWMFLIKAQPFVMPCALCKQHFLEFIKIKPFGNLRTIQGESRRAWVTKWLWECHRRVNEMNQKSTPHLEDLAILYPKQPLHMEIKDIVIMFQHAHSIQQLKSEDTNRWRQQLARLRILYGI
jgi:hypothetical protein